jgi:hypothetical protein
MSKMPRIVAIIAIVGGAFMIVAGGITYYVVHRELADQHITVSADAKNFGGDSVGGPFTAYAQAMAIKGHAEKIGGGKTYSELAQDDPNRQTVLTAVVLAGVAVHIGRGVRGRCTRRGVGCAVHPRGLGVPRGREAAAPGPGSALSSERRRVMAGCRSSSCALPTGRAERERLVC